MQKTYSELVELDKSRLIELGNMIDRVDLPLAEQRTADLLECLDEHREQYERDGRPNAENGRSLESVDVEHAWRSGIAPERFRSDSGHAYLAKLEDLTGQSRADPAAFSALTFHAAEMIAADQCMPVPLRRFVFDFLTGQIDRPRPSGRPRKTALPDLAVVRVVEELVETYGLKAIGSVASEHEGSACAIVAQAMTDLRRRPSSISAIAAMWFAFKRAERG